MGFAAIVLAGGRARRMGGVLKPLLRVGGMTMLERALAAVAGARPIVVVGPSELDDHLAGVLRVQEQPPGGGPVAGLAAGFAALPPAALAGDVVVLAADLPFLTGEAIAGLRAAGDCAVYVEQQGRRQPLVARWSASGLSRALAAVPAENASMKELLAAASVVELPWPGHGPPPWFDCDTPQALEEADRWLRQTFPNG